NQNVVNGRVLKQWLERSQPEYLVQNFQRKPFAFATAQRGLEVGDQVLNNRQHLSARVLVSLGCDSLQIDSANQIAVNAGFQLLIFLERQTSTLDLSRRSGSRDTLCRY